VASSTASSGPLAASWHSNKFLDPVGDGAVLPILHLNGYKIANPAVLARIGDAGCGPVPFAAEAGKRVQCVQRPSP